MSTELFNLYLSLLCAPTFPVSIHPLNHLMLPLLNGHQINRCKSIGEIPLQTSITVIAVVSEIFFDCTQKEPNEIEFTVKFWEEDAQVTSVLENQVAVKESMWCSNQLLQHHILVSCIPFSSLLVKALAQ